jgi:tetratricopeptide (TPR) repeat protein
MTRLGLVLSVLAVDLAALVYLNGLHNPFVYDDRFTILGNPSLRDPTLQALTLHSVFRPVVNVSYAVDHALWGFRPVGYHLTSLVLHAVNVALLFSIVRRAVQDWQARDSNLTTERSPDVVAFVAAAGFAVHPMMTEAVTYVSGRSDVLCATFFLLGMVTMRRALVNGRLGWALLGLTSLGLALGAKEVAASFPLVLLAYDRLLLDPAPEARRRRFRYLHLPLISVIAIASVARLYTFFHAETRGLVAPIPYLGGQLIVVWRYLRLLLLPLGQSLVHSVHEVRSFSDPRMLIAAGGLIAVWLLALAWRRRAPLCALGVVWFFVVLAPSSVVPLGEPMAEHRVYLASLGFFVVIGDLAGAVFARCGRLGVPARTVAIGIAAYVLVVFAALTVARNAVWADPVELWRDATRQAPDVWRAHFSLANTLGEAGRCGEAIPEFEIAGRLSPQGQIFLNLGACLIAEGRLADAARSYVRALEVEPGYAAAHYQLGLLSLRVADRDRAQQHFVKAVTSGPNDTAWRVFLVRRHEAMFHDAARTLEFCREVQRIAGPSHDVEECVRRNERR